MSLCNSKSKYNRRTLLKSGMLASGTALTLHALRFPVSGQTAVAKSIRISKVDSNFEREPLIRPFGFKGGYMTKIWQTACRMESSSGMYALGLCSQNVLWSDAQVFSMPTAAMRKKHRC